MYIGRERGRNGRRRKQTKKHNKDRLEKKPKEDLGIFGTHTKKERRERVRDRDRERQRGKRQTHIQKDR